MVMSNYKDVFLLNISFCCCRRHKFFFTACNCNLVGSVNGKCDLETSQCECRVNFAGLLCDKCADGYYDYPRCECWFQK